MSMAAVFLDIEKDFYTLLHYMAPWLVIQTIQIAIFGWYNQAY
jgi:hypothetical protein